MQDFCWPGCHALDPEMTSAILDGASGHPAWPDLDGLQTYTPWGRWVLPHNPSVTVAKSTDMSSWGREDRSACWTSGGYPVVPAWPPTPRTQGRHAPALELFSELRETYDGGFL